MNPDQNADQSAGSPPPPPSAPPTGGAPTAPAHDKNVTMAVLAYLSVLILVPYFTAKQDPFVHFHIKQGAVLFGVEVLIWLFSGFLWFLGPLYIIIQLIDLVVLVLVIIGIVHAVKGEEKPLPVIGSFAAGLNI